MFSQVYDNWLLCVSGMMVYELVCQSGNLYMGKNGKIQGCLHYLLENDMI